MSGLGPNPWQYLDLERLRAVQKNVLRRRWRLQFFKWPIFRGSKFTRPLCLLGCINFSKKRLCPTQYISNVLQVSKTLWRNIFPTLLPLSNLGQNPLGQTWTASSSLQWKEHNDDGKRLRTELLLTLSLLSLQLMLRSVHKRKSNPAGGRTYFLHQYVYDPNYLNYDNEPFVVLVDSHHANIWWRYYGLFNQLHYQRHLRGVWTSLLVDVSPPYLSLNPLSITTYGATFIADEFSLTIPMRA